MAQLKFDPRSYAAIVARVPTGGMTIGNNTRATADTREARVTLHGSTVARFRRTADPLHVSRWRADDGDGIAMFDVMATLDTCGWHTPTTLDRLQQMIPEYAPTGLRLSLSRGQAYADMGDGFRVPFDRLHFTTAGEVIAYHEARPTRVA